MGENEKFFLISLVLLGLVLTGCIAFIAPFIGSELDPYGFIDKRGIQVLNLKTKETSLNDLLPTSFTGGYCRVFIQRNIASESCQRYFANYMDRSGALLFKNFSMLEAREFSEGLAAVRTLENDSHSLNMPASVLNTCWRFIDKNRAVQCGPYKNVLDFSEGLAGVNPSNSKTWQFVDHRGKIAFPLKFESVTAFKEGRASVRIGGKWGLIDRAGRFVLSPQLPVKVGSFNEGFAPIIYPDKKYVDYIGRDGAIKLRIERTKVAGKKFIYLDSLCHGLRVCETSPGRTNWAPEAFEEKVSEGLVVIQANGKYGFGDLNGKIVIEPCFDYCWPFSCGRALVYNENNFGGRFGYVLKTGQFIRPCEFVKAYSYSEDFAVASTNWRTDYFKYFDLNGRECFGRELPAAQPFHEGLAFVGKRTIWP